MKQVFILIIHTTYYQRGLTYLIPIFLGLTLANSQIHHLSAYFTYQSTVHLYYSCYQIFISTFHTTVNERNKELENSEKEKIYSANNTSHRYV